MKIVDDDKLILFLNKKYLNSKLIFNFDNIEEYFKTIFEILNENYKIKLKGLYNIDVYIDNDYGVILEILKQDYDFDYFDQIDMDIQIHKNNFLIRINDLEPFINTRIYKYRDEYYTNDLDKVEFGELIYNTEAIMKNLKIIEI